MPTVTSADGTTIAYETAGAGPVVVLVDGAMCFRDAGPMRPLAALLEPHLTVVLYDRRGRGASDDVAPYSVAREVDDLRALVRAAGGEASVYGMSSGAALALLAAADRVGGGVGVTRLAMYEPPYIAEADGDARTSAYSARLDKLLAAGLRGDAVELFMTHVGVPAEMVGGMRRQPFWSAFEAIAPTLDHDDTVMGDSRVPRTVAAGVSVPTLVLSGGASPQNLQTAAKAAADAVPGAEHRVLAGQTHDVRPEVLAPVLLDFFR